MKEKDLINNLIAGTIVIGFLLFFVFLVLSATDIGIDSSDPTQIPYNIEWLLIGIVGIIIAELIFWFSELDKRPKGRGIFHHTSNQKIVCIILGVSISSALYGIYRIIRLLVVEIPELGSAIISFVGVGALIVIILVGWIYANSIKFRLQEKKPEKKKRKTK